MTCRELIEFLDDYVDGRLSAMERAKFEVHLAICRDCRAYLRSYRDTIGMARSVAVAEEAATKMPEELVRAIMESRKR